MLDATLKTIAVCQGELAVSGDRNVILSAILGSCVATCLWDPDARIGGMNHILLPGRKDAGRQENKYGVFAMEALINVMMQNGARKSNLRAKIFGGAQTFENGLRIGEANALFVRDFLELEGIPIDGESLGGTQARRIRFFPEDGKAKQLLTGDDALASIYLRDTGDVVKKKVAMPARGSGEVELF